MQHQVRAALAPEVLKGLLSHRVVGKAAGCLAGELAKATIGDSPAINPDPAKRSQFIDPTTILKRRKPPITWAEREALRKLAEAL